MTNLLIAYPDIPDGGIQASATTDNEKDTVFGGKARVAKLNTSATGTVDYLYDLGSGVTATAQYLAIGRANLLQKSGVTTITLSGSSDGISYSTVYTNASFASATLTGTNSEDFFITFATSTAYRYWRFRADSGATDSYKPLSKIYFGTLFDLGRDPIYPVIRTLNSVEDKTARQLITFEFNYDGITDAKKESFETYIGRFSGEHTYFIYDSSNTYVLGGYNPVYCRILSYSFNTTATINNNTLSIIFEEVF